MLNRSRVLSVLDSLAATLDQEVAVRPWLLVDHEGRIARWAIDASGSSGALGRDTLLSPAMREVRFAPATFMDEPICAWVRLPFHLNP